MIGSNRALTENDRVRFRLCFNFFRHFLGRLYIFAIILAFESVLVAGFIHVRLSFHSPLLQIAIVSFAVFLGLGYSGLKAQQEDLPFNFIFFGGYLACTAAELCVHVLMTPPQGDVLNSFRPSYLILDALILLKVPLLALACIPFRSWIRTFRATNPLWFYACLTGCSASFLIGPSQSLWSQSDVVPGSILQPATFTAVQMVLGLFVPNVVADSASFLIGTPRYTFFLGYGCAGMEGLGLIFVFTSVWLWYSRKECRFPQALLLVPCALVCIWLLNIVRLCALVIIGNAGLPEVAEIGFHSRFGWISFTAIALVFSLLTQRLSWVRKAPASTSNQPPSGKTEAVDATGEWSAHQGESPAIRAYLLPFLAILAATFVSKAASGNFEWLYPLRFVAAVIAIHLFWPELKKLNWRFGWFGPAAGVAVFVAWIAPSWWSHQQAVSSLGAELARLSPTARWAWIAIRIAAAVVTVPIAEELAFRGYLARRLISQEFDQVSFSSLTALSICLSSVVFGLEHMKDLKDWQHLILGTLAGLAFAAALRWRGRIGDAVVAHSVSNLLLAAWVLGLGDWAQW